MTRTHRIYPTEWITIRDTVSFPCPNRYTPGILNIFISFKSNLSRTQRKYIRKVLVEIREQHIVVSPSQTKCRAVSYLVAVLSGKHDLLPRLM